MGRISEFVEGMKLESNGIVRDPRRYNRLGRAAGTKI